MRVTREHLRNMILEQLGEITDILPETQIFCDMDGVLVNFEKAIVALVNQHLDAGDLPHLDKSKGYRKRLRRIRGDLGTEWRAQSRSDLDIKSVRNFMMGAIGSNPGHIFANMEPWPDAISELWPFINSTGHVVNLLTAPIPSRPGADGTSEEGKILWAEQLDPPPSSIIMSSSSEKQRYAVIDGVPNILIDDKASTIDAWNGMAPGFGILHIPGKSRLTIQQLINLGLQSV